MDEERVLSAVRQLGEQLQRHKAISDSIVKDGQDPESEWAEEYSQHWWQRRHAYDSLHAVLEFLSAMPKEWHGLDAALYQLTYALLDIEDGRKPEWLLDVKRVDEDGNRPLGAVGVKAKIAMDRAVCAAVMEILYRDGNYTREKAATYVMSHLPDEVRKRLVGKYRGREVGWRTYERWREKMGEDHPAWLIYKDRIAKVPGQPKAEERARRLLSRFARTP